MARFGSPLNDLKIASPCSANWDEMVGNDRQRFCGDCKLNVYNLSGMTDDEAESLIINAEGRVCVRMYRRSDGSVITRDCPVGWARVKRRVRAISTAVVSLIAGLFSGLLFVSIFTRLTPQVEVGAIGVTPLSTPTPQSTPTPIPLMGAVSINANTNVRREGEATMGKVAVPRSEKQIGNSKRPEIMQ
jgi:hypothetical protein